jgi:Na+-translocating ferredoxin:NAD+ oxidoreductase RnfG subunit
MTEPEAVERLLGPVDRLTRVEVTADEAHRAAIAAALGVPVPETRFSFVRGDRDGRPVGWVYIGEEKGLYEPITFAVAIAPDASVEGVAILVYRESRGGEVSRRRFLDQFRGKTARSPLRLNKDILNITGATVSSRAVTLGVKKALVAFDVLDVGAAAGHATRSE